MAKLSHSLTHFGHHDGLGAFNGSLPGYIMKPSCVQGHLQMRQPAIGLHGGQSGVGVCESHPHLGGGGGLSSLPHFFEVCGCLLLLPSCLPPFEASVSYSNSTSSII